MDGRTENWIMKRLLHAQELPSRRRNPKWPTDRCVARDTITPWCGPASFSLSFFLAGISLLKISELSFYEIKLLLTYLQAELTANFTYRSIRYCGAWRMPLKRVIEAVALPLLVKRCSLLVGPPMPKTNNVWAMLDSGGRLTILMVCIKLQIVQRS